MINALPACPCSLCFFWSFPSLEELYTKMDLSPRPPVATKSPDSSDLKFQTLRLI